MQTTDGGTPRAQARRDPGCHYRRRAFPHRRRGLNGYTVEEVCERGGISRRTFFNYFPTKEDAIIGHADDELPAGVVEDFIGGGGSRRPAKSPPPCFRTSSRCPEAVRN